MPYGLYLSAAGANAQNHRLEVLNHNLANVATPGFKPHLAVLKSRDAEALERGDVPPGTGGVDDIGGGVTVSPSLTTFEAGSIRTTGRPTDFAIKDTQSFFVIQRGDQQLLTRAGNFNFNNAGQLVTPIGEPVLSDAGQPVTINPLLPYNVLDHGVIEQAGQKQALMLAKPREPGDLTRLGDNLYQSLTPVTQTPATERAVLGGSIEESAVKPVKAMVELIEASRAYEANIKMIQNQDQTIGSLISRVLSD